MSTPDRAARIAAYRTALDIVAADESLPLPSLPDYRIAVQFYLHGKDAPRQLAALEAAFTGAGAGPFTRGVKHDAAGVDRWTSEGNLGGVPVLIQAPALDVAKRIVTGQRTEDIFKWVPLPAGDADPENGEKA